MVTYTLEDLARYDNVMPKANYSCLEDFLNSIDDDSLFELRKTGVKAQQGAAQPFEQIYLMVTLGNIFVNEYGQKEFTYDDYIKLFPVFLTSVLYEAIYRFKPQIPRADMWRELVPSQIKKYKINEQV